MGCGDHYDAAVMPLPNAMLRTDLSFTVFLSDPDDYEGGELVVVSEYTERVAKRPAGDMVFYPSARLHRVNEVTAGERQVGVGWVQSMVASTEQRQVLYDIHIARNHILESEGKTAEFERLNSAYLNLQRMWAQP